MGSKKIPLYQMIAGDMLRRIQSGTYKPGQRIPTIRQIAVEFGCNKVTVQKAFESLHRRGIIENKVGSGSYVRFPHTIHSPTGPFDFRTDYLDESLFPYHRIQAIINDLFNTRKGAVLSLAPVEGEPELLKELSHFYHLPVKGMLIISGAQQGLDLVAKVFSANISDVILFEDPTYPGAISLFKARHFVTMHNDGPDIEQLDQRLCAPLRLFYTMPSVQNPTGMGYSMEKKQAVAKRAREHDFFIIEDDYLGELRPSSLRFVDICPDRTIYIKSFAQTSQSGIRLGFMVVPEDLIAGFVYAKYSSDISSFGLLQRAWREFIANGDYGRHLELVRNETEIRRRRLCNLIARYSFLSADQNQTGYSLWVRSDRELLISQVPWSRGGDFSFSLQYRLFFKIAFMNMPEETYARGLDFLAGIFAA